jgi:hypothetical protein
MSFVRSCAHCYHMFSPRCENEEACSECREALARLDSECNSRPDPEAERRHVQVAIHRMKRRMRAFPPANLRDVIVWLLEHPYVRITGPTPRSLKPSTREEAFVRYEDGSLWFRGFDGESHIPVTCTRSDAAARAQTSIEFDRTGFTVGKFGASIRVEYLS